jgi:threonine dehydratase
MTKEKILEAHTRISPFINKTPVFTSSTFNTLTGVDTFFKCENFQKVGAFKARGATYALSELLKENKRKLHVATHSSGNHAQALAWAARQFNCEATIVMPSNSPEVKKSAVKGYGAKVIECEPTLVARETTLQQVLKETNAVFVPPYNDENIVTGAATCALELMNEVEVLDAIFTPVGGGGLLSGTALAAKYFSDAKTKVYAAEPEAADDAYQSFKSKTFVPSNNPLTIADGLKTSLGEINLPIILNHVSDVFTVTEEEIKKALFFVYERMKIVIEPSSAVTVAALINNAELFKGKRVGVIISGGNVDLKQFSDWK